MDKRKGLIFLIILFIIIIVFILMALKDINLDEEKPTYQYNNSSAPNNMLVNNAIINNEIEQNITNEIVPSDEIKFNITDPFEVNEGSVYYTIKDIADKFFETINYAFNEDCAKEEFFDGYLSEMEYNKEKLYSILGDQYIKNNGITKENLENKFSKYISSTYDIDKMVQKIDENNIGIFIINGKINEKTTYNMAIITDETNLNYSIYPYEYLESNNIYDLKISRINGNKYNKLQYKNIEDQTLAKDYFANYKYYVQKDGEKIYNKLDSEYSKRRFGSFEAFKKYINDNIYAIKNGFLESYKVTRRDDYVQYDCIDNFGNHYIFKETSIMQYTLMLDNYTVMLDEDIEYYNNLDKFDKSKYNLNKFISMVNTKHYDPIYNFLDDSFRKNNFAGKNEFIEYIKENMYDLNSIQIEDFDDENHGYCTFELTLTDLTNEKINKKMFVVINQTESDIFTMSFSF